MKRIMALAGLLFSALILQDLSHARSQSLLAFMRAPFTRAVLGTTSGEAFGSSVLGRAFNPWNESDLLQLATKLERGELATRGKKFSEAVKRAQLRYDVTMAGRSSADAMSALQRILAEEGMIRAREHELGLLFVEERAGLPSFEASRARFRGEPRTSLFPVSDYTPAAGTGDDELRRIVMGRVNTNDFMIYRFLDEYADSMPGEFAAELAALGPDGHWFDGGAGEAYATEQYVSGQPYRSYQDFNTLLFQKFSLRPPTTRARATAVSFDIERGPIPTYGGRLRTITGRYFSRISNSEIGPADLITDHYGIFAYSTDPDVVLRRYLTLLKDDGSIYLVMSRPPHRGANGGHEVFVEVSSVIGKDGVTRGMAEWVSRIKGIDAQLIRSLDGSYSLRIRKIPGVRIRVPKLRLVEAADGGPPRRVFIEE